jgi:hypothetical protein
MKFVVLVPEHEVPSGRIINLSAQDTFVVGDLPLPAGSILITTVPTPGLKTVNPGIKIIEIKDERPNLANIVEKTIRENNGVVIQQKSTTAAASSLVSADGVEVTELELFKHYGLLKDGLSRGQAHYGLEGDATVLGALELISQKFFLQNHGHEITALELKLMAEVYRKISDPYEKQLLSRGLLSPSVRRHFDTLRNVVSAWEKRGSPATHVETIKDLQVPEVALALRQLSKEDYLHVVKTHRLDKDPDFFRIQAYVHAIKAFEGNTRDRRYHLKQLETTLSHLPLDIRTELVDELFNNFLKLGLHPGSEYLPSLFEIILLKPFFEAVSLNPNRPKSVKSLTELFQALLPHDVPLGDGTPKDVEAQKIMKAIVGKSAYSFDPSEIDSWDRFKSQRFNIKQEMAKLRRGLKQVYSPLSSTDTGPFDNYTEHSFYRDIYEHRFGSITDLRTKLNLNEQFVADFPNYRALFSSHLSMMEVLERYRIKK